MAQIAKVLQSKSDFRIHIPFTINLVIVKIPLGGRKVRRYVSWKQFKTKSTSIVEIINTGADEKDESRKNLCLARSIVVGKAYADNGPEKEAIRHTKSTQQRKLALELHANAGVPLGLCGLPEIQKFQDHFLGQYQINVISLEHRFNCVFSGPAAPKQIFIVYGEKHFDVITSMTGFLNRSYYCAPCNAAFNDRTRHHCANFCKFCLRPECGQDEVEHWIQCQDCNCFFRNQSCYDQHRSHKDKNRTLCERLKRCTVCHRIYSRANEDKHKEILCSLQI